MGIVWWILKAAGIFLLAILCLILFLLALILFVPIRYRAEGDWPEGGRPQGSARVTWAFPLVGFTVGYAESLELKLRILGITVFPRKKKTKASEAEGSEKENVSVPETEEELAAELAEMEKELEEVGSAEIGKTAELSEGAKSAGTLTEKNELKEKRGSETAEKNAVISGQTKEAKGADETDKESASETDADTSNHFSAIHDKIEQLVTKVEYYRNLLSTDDSQALIGKVLNILKKLLLHLKPRKLQADLTIGTGDPASTGTVAAVYGMLYPWLGNQVVLNTDFEQKRIAGTVSLKGRIRLCVPVYQVLRLLIDRRFYKLLKELKKGGNI